VAETPSPLAVAGGAKRPVVASFVVVPSVAAAGFDTEPAADSDIEVAADSAVVPVGGFAVQTAEEGLAAVAVMDDVVGDLPVSLTFAS